MARTDARAGAQPQCSPAPRRARASSQTRSGVVQDTVIGMASSAPAATIGLSLAALVAATAYGSGPILILTAIPMLIIANAYRRCNMWNANCGASFEWVGRAISPYLGYLTGWLMVVAYIIGTVAEILLLGPSVLAVFGSTSTSSWAWIAIGTVVAVVMLTVAIAGIRFTARTQVGMAIVEYAILIGFAIWGLVAVLSHHHGTFGVTHGWFSLTGIDGKGSAVAGFLVAVFVYGGWDGTLYVVNEEVRQRRVNPGRAAVVAVALLAIIYTLAQVGLQGVVSPAQLQKDAGSGSALVDVAQALGGSNWSQGDGAVHRPIRHRDNRYRNRAELPDRLRDGQLPGTAGFPEQGIGGGSSTPVVASVVVGVLLIALTWVYLLATSVQNAFFDVIDVTGLLFAIFYILTALATIVYYRRRVFSGAWDALILGLLPLGAAGFLGWMFEQSVQVNAPWTQRWSLIGIIGLGLVMMFWARFIAGSPFFRIPRESDSGTPSQTA